MINFKHEKDEDCFLFISPTLGMVMLDMYQFFDKCGIDFVVTSVIRKEGEGVSTTHQEGRAFDVRLKHIAYTEIGKEFIDDFTSYFNHKYSNIAAVSSSTGKPRLIVVHGTGDSIHAHVQLNRKYTNLMAQNFFKDKGE